MKKLIALLLALAMVLSLAACGAKTDAPAATEAPKADAPAAEPPKAEEPKVEENLTETQKIIKEAQTMTLEELAKKAIEESNGAMFYGLGNSSRGKTALLRDTDDTVAEIMQILGYSNRTYFYRIFRQKYGLTPKEYREQPSR